MAADPAAVVVATWTTADGWALRDMGGANLSATLRAVLAGNLSTAEAQRTFFAPLLQSSDPATARMAMIELATLPYPVLRETPVRVDRHAVIAILSDQIWAEWAPVMILMLGLSDDPADITFVHRAVRVMAQGDRTAHLAAWTTALLEMEGEAGLEWLQDTYVADRARSDVEMREIGLALGTHAGRDDATGATIRAALSDLAERQPAMMGALARALTERGDWSLAPAFSRWLEAGRITAPDDAFFVTDYVLAAAEAQNRPTP